MNTIDYDVTFEPIHKHRRPAYQYPHFPERFTYAREAKSRFARCRATGKVRFKTEQLALARAAEILSAPNARAANFRAYACDLCSGWHLTSK